MLDISNSLRRLRVPRPLTFAAALALAAALPAFAAAQEAVTADTAWTVEGTAAGSSVEAEDGSVLPGDRIRIAIWNEPAMSNDYHVDERGHVVLPKVGSLEVRGLDPAGARERIHEAYSRYLENPSVQVTVLRRIGVHGEVKAPTVYWLDVTMSVRDAIALAGGVTPQGEEDEITLVRGEERLELEGEGTAALVDAGLSSGDQIVVGRKSWFRLNAPIVLSTGVSLLSLFASFAF